jgi:DNA-binding transcriptional LysR family regulator
MDRRQIEYFLAVVDHRGITRAAKALYVAQPTLTQGIQSLEASLHAELFTRGPRGVELTSTGLALVEPARRIMAGLEDVERIAELHLQLAVGLLEIVSVPDLAIDPLVPLVAGFVKRFPGVQVSVRDLERGSTIASALRQGRAELGLTVLPMSERGLTSRRVGSRGLLLVHPRESKFPKGPMKLQDLETIPLVTGRLGSASRDAVETVVQAAGGRVSVGVEVDHEEQIRDLVLAGAGSALLPKLVAEDARRLGAAVRTVEPGILQHIGLVFLDGHRSPVARALLGVLPRADDTR